MQEIRFKSSKGPMRVFNSILNEVRLSLRSQTASDEKGHISEEVINSQAVWKSAVQAANNTLNSEPSNLGDCEFGATSAYAPL
jgi:hypothetical protein